MPLNLGHGVGVITGTGVQVDRTLVVVGLGTGVDVATAVGSGSAVAVRRDVGSGIAVPVGRGVGTGAALEQAITKVPISTARTTVIFMTATWRPWSVSLSIRDIRYHLVTRSLSAKCRQWR